MKNGSAAEGSSGVAVRGFDPAVAKALSSQMKLDPLAAKFLAARGIATSAEAADYLYPRLSRLHSPFLLDDMIPAVERLRRAIDTKEKVAVFSDSDIDGLTSLTILNSLLEGAGVPVVFSYPCGEENYGLSLRAIDEFASAGATLIVTLDCGIRDTAEIAAAKQKGIDVLVCDHHEQGPELPDAIVVDQKRTGSQYPCRDLAGAGVALKLCHALLLSYLPMYGKSFGILTREADSVEFRILRNGIVLQSLAGQLDSAMIEAAHTCDTVLIWNISVADAEQLSDLRCPFEPFDHLLVQSGYAQGKTSPSDVKEQLGLPGHIPVSTGDLAQEAFFDMSCIRPKKISAFLSKWLPLAATGTIADVMPLLGENRIIVACGLRAFDSCGIPSIRKLNDAFAPVTAKTVGWQIAPLLNTPGRLGRTELAAEFFLSGSVERCEPVMKEISRLNDERKGFLKEKLSMYTKELSDGLPRGAKNFIYIKAADVTDGFTGLIAGRLADALGCPAVVVSSAEGRDVFKGSGRASGGIDFLSYVEPFAARFERFGGHAGAFGFSAKESVIDDIMRELDASLEGVVFAKKGKTADFEIDDTGEITERSVEILSRCEPFGAGNEPPLFLSRGVPVLRFESFGSDGRHGKFICGGRSTAAVGWSLAGQMKEYDVADGAAFLYTAEFDQYTRRVRFVIDELL